MPGKIEDTRWVTPGTCRVVDMPVSVKQYTYLAPVQTFSAETMWTQEATQGRQGHVGPYDTHLSHSELRPSSGQWLSRLEDLSGYVLDSISDIGDPPDVTCNDLSDDESDCEYSDEDSASSTESYNDFIRRRAQAVLAAKEAWINLKFARKRAEIEYKLIDMEKEAQLLQLKVDTMDEILFFKQTGGVKIRSKPLDSVSDTHRRKVFDTHPSMEVKETVVEQKTTDCVIDQNSDPSVVSHCAVPSNVNPVAPPAKDTHVISDTCDKIAGLKAGSFVIINHLQRKVINLETKLYGSSTQSEDGEFRACGSLSQIQAHAIAIIENLQAKIVSLQRQFSARKCEQSADILSGLTEAEVYDIPEMEMDSGCQTQSSCSDIESTVPPGSEYVNQPPGGESWCMKPPGGESGHMKPPGGESGHMKPSSSECVNQPPGGGSSATRIAVEPWIDSSPPVGRISAGHPISLQSSEDLKYKVKLKHFGSASSLVSLL